MSFQEPQFRRLERQQRLRARRRRFAALGALAIAVVVAAAIALASTTGSQTKNASRSAATVGGKHAAQASGHGAGLAGPSPPDLNRGTGVPGNTKVPILMYHVINPPPSGAPFPGLYVPANEFAAQMQALKAAGWHAVTLDQLTANWTRGVPLGPGKPIVLSFDNGYESQYTNAMPVLKQLGWPAVENIQLTGLPPSQGGLTDAQVRGLIAAGWELDTQGISHADLVTLDSSQLRYQVTTARQILRSRYGVPVDWFCYPSGHYNSNVIDVVRSAGYKGSTTVVPGWAGPQSDPFRLPRLRVLGGTSPSQLLAQISSAESDSPPPGTYTGS